MNAFRILTLALGLGLSAQAGFAQATKPVLTAYLDLKDALVASDARKAKAKATVLLKELDQLKTQKLSAADRKRLHAIDTSAFSICKSMNLDGQRNFFEALSVNMIGLVKSTRPNQVYVQYCPMADDNRGAYWLSAQKEIANPYFGNKMLRCGKVTEAVK